MRIHLIALCLMLSPTMTLAQQNTNPGECDQVRSCPAGQIMDSSSKSCMDITA